MRKKLLILHPFFFALFLPIFIIANNPGQIFIREALPLCSAILISIISFYILFKKILKQDSQKAGLITSGLLLFLYSYGSVYTLLNQLTLIRHRLLLPALLILVIILLINLIKTKRDFTIISELLNYASIIIVGISLFSTSTYYIKLTLNNRITEKQSTLKLPLQQKNNLPDIYYIILDGYIPPQTSYEVFDYDNHEFTEFLNKQGFYVSPHSKANYHMTFLSLAASLNMKYLDYSYQTKKIKNNDFLGPFQLIRNNEVMRLLKEQGYTIIINGNWWGPTASNKYADISIDKYGYINEFLLTVMRNTIFNIIVDEFQAHFTRKMIWNNFEVLKIVPEMKEPTFLFTHLMLPHTPYIFGPNGEPKSVDLDTLGDYKIAKKHYFDQFLFATQQIEQTIAIILQKSERTPIIIIQSDHGWAFDSIYERRIIERMRIFNAYLLPEDGNDLLYETISPVNTFRLIFQHYFNGEIALLEDRNYYSTRLYDCTKLLNAADISLPKK